MVPQGMAFIFKCNLPSSSPALQWLHLPFLNCSHTWSPSLLPCSSTTTVALPPASLVGMVPPSSTPTTSGSLMMDQIHPAVPALMQTSSQPTFSNWFAKVLNYPDTKIPCISGTYLYWWPMASICANDALLSLSTPAYGHHLSKKFAGKYKL